MSPSACPECGTEVWEIIEFSGGSESAVEIRECVHGHAWTVVLTA